MNLSQSSKVSLDIKSIIAFGFVILSLAGTYFTLTASVQQQQIEISRLHSEVEMNSEFRIKWPRGEMGALPDDAEQNLRLTYLEKHLEELRKENKDLKQKVIKMENCIND